MLENKLFFALRKPHWIATTFGKTESFLDVNFSKWSLWIEEEYGLLNRLDTDTAGLLFFAKTKEFYDWYKSAQRQLQINKHYFAVVAGKFPQTLWEINFPLLHHPHDDTRMLVVKKDFHKHKRLLSCSTFYEVLEYDSMENVSYLSVRIQKGQRHQIRAHLASIGHPVIWDKLYNKVFSDKNLQLFSVGIEFEYK